MRPDDEKNFRCPAIRPLPSLTPQNLFDFAGAPESTASGKAGVRNAANGPSVDLLPQTAGRQGVCHMAVWAEMTRGCGAGMTRAFSSPNAKKKPFAAARTAGSPKNRRFLGVKSGAGVISDPYPSVSGPAFAVQRRCRGPLSLCHTPGTASSLLPQS